LGGSKGPAPNKCGRRLPFAPPIAFCTATSQPAPLEFFISREMGCLIPKRSFHRTTVRRLLARLDA
jgi:hypothetical protein